jgi:hypothetical protein
MKRWLGFLLLSTMPVLTWASAPPGPITPSYPAAVPAATFANPAKAPKIKFLTVKHDFGKVEEGPEVKKLFRFANLGKGTLRIERVQPSCGCTGAEADGRNEIPPGESGAIRVSYNTNGRPGHTIKTVTVVTNDPNNQQVVLTFEVDVVRDIDINPGQVYFFNVKHRESKTLSVTILAKAGKPFKVLEAKSANGAVSVALTPYVEKPVPPAAGPSRKGAVLEVTLPADREIGDIFDEIVCKTDSLKKPEIKVPVNGSVIGRVQVMPKNVYLSGKGGEATTVTVVADPPEGFSVRRVDVSKGTVKPWVKKTRSADGKTQWMVRLAIPRGLPDGPIEDELVLYTSDAEQPEIKVPVRGNKVAPPPPQKP